MISAKCDELRAMAESIGLEMPQAATLMMGAADIINDLSAENDNLRKYIERKQDLQHFARLKAENAKLRELVSEIAKLVTNPYGGCLKPGCAHGCPHHLECDEELHTCFYVDRMRELGVEV